MFKVLIPALGLLGLVTVGARAPSAAEAQPMGWHLTYEGPVAKLAYGVANSDQLVLMLACDAGSDAAYVWGAVEPQASSVVLAANGVATRAEPREVIDAMTGAPAMETVVSMRDPAMRAFTRTGALTVTGDAGEFNMPADHDEKALIAQFSDHCAAQHA